MQRNLGVDQGHPRDGIGLFSSGCDGVSAPYVDAAAAPGEDCEEQRNRQFPCEGTRVRRWRRPAPP